MKIARSGIFALTMALASAGSLLAEGELAKPMSTATAMKSSVVDVVDDIDMKALNLYDATADVEFIINPEGDVALISIDGENCVINTYIEQMLKDKKIYVTENLSNKVHKVTIRYVRI